MKKSRLVLATIVYVTAVGLCGTIFNIGRAAADPVVRSIDNTNLTSVSAAQTYLKNSSNRGYLTYLKGNKILYRINAGPTWNEITDSTDIVEDNRGTGDNEQNGCVKILDDNIYTFRVRFRSNYSGYDGGNCGNVNAKTNAQLVYSGGRVNIDPPDGVPMAIFIRDIDSANADWQRIYLTKTALTFVYTPNSGAKFDYSNTSAYGRLATKGNGLCNDETNPKCNALVLVSANSFYAKVMMKSLQGLMDIRNDMNLEYRTLTLNPNGGSVTDNGGDGTLLRSYPSSGMVVRDYERGNTATTFPTPTRAGHTFLGWYDAAIGGTRVCSPPISPPSCSRSMGNDVTVYAHWNPIIVVVPGASCQPLSLIGMALNKPGTYTPAIKLSNVAVRPTFSYRIYKQDASIPPYTTVAPQVTDVSPNQTLSTPVNFTPTLPGPYILEWQVTGSVSKYCPATTNVGYQPYFSVIGGDILGGFSAATSIVASWNSNTAADNYAGAGTTLAAIAGTNIEGFVTSSASNDPTRLAFANTLSSIDPLNGLYGGDFATTLEKPDYYANASGTDRGCSIPPTSSSLQSGLYTCLGDITINGGNVPAGVNATIKINGNVFIAGDIGYDPHNLTDIPRLNIYAKGNIVVSSQVAIIHGVLVAQNNGAGGGGRFYSCGSSATNPFDYTLNDPQCMDKTLTVFGSVVADELVLGRTIGSWTDPSPAPAETFIYSPETWLSKPNDASTNKPPKWDSYISLPPVL